MTDIQEIRHRLMTHYNGTDVEQEAIDVASLLDKLREIVNAGDALWFCFTERTPQVEQWAQATRDIDRG